MSNNNKSGAKAHSEEYFGEYRDFWWNLDFLKLRVQGLDLDKVKNVLDVGCGRGHWGQFLSRVFPSSTEFQGVDLEASSIEFAKAKAKEKNLENRFKYKIGDALNLPFEDESFDVVTCQTLLIHLKNPKSCLMEMLRVLKPNGRLLIAEPNNFANRAVASSLTDSLSIEEVMDRLKFDLTIQRGKRSLGLGYNSLGDFVPGYLAELGLVDIEVYNSDKTSPLIPPYSSVEEQVIIKQLKEWTERDFLGWDRDEMKRYYIAGGGEDHRFDYFWNLWLSDAKESLRCIEEKTYHSAGGGMQYLILARKSEQS